MSVDVEFLTPYDFLIAAVLGVLLGAFTLFFWHRGKGKSGGQFWSWLASLGFGFGMVIAVWAGFELPFVSKPELLSSALIAPFGLAFIASFFMTVIVAHFGKKS